jgi:hypothetical protein
LIRPILHLQPIPLSAIRLLVIRGLRDWKVIPALVQAQLEIPAWVQDLMAWATTVLMVLVPMVLAAVLMVPVLMVLAVRAQAPVPVLMVLAVAMVREAVPTAAVMEEAAVVMVVATAADDGRARLPHPR